MLLAYSQPPNFNLVKYLWFGLKRAVHKHRLRDLINQYSVVLSLTRESGLSTEKEGVNISVTYFLGKCRIWGKCYVGVFHYIPFDVQYFSCF